MVVSDQWSNTIALFLVGADLPRIDTRRCLIGALSRHFYPVIRN